MGCSLIWAAFLAKHWALLCMVGDFSQLMLLCNKLGASSNLQQTWTPRISALIVDCKGVVRKMVAMTNVRIGAERKHES